MGSVEMTEDALLHLLEEHGVDSGLFGQGEAKSLSHLMKELREGECSLRSVDGTLQRVVYGATAVVRHSGLVLVEDRQVFKDGRVRRRDIIGSIGEKMKPDEDPLLAARRALAEELGITDPAITLSYEGILEKDIDFSQSYPGLTTLYVMHHFSIELPEEHFRPDGYVEHQSDKSTYWVWQPLAQQ